MMGNKAPLSDMLARTLARIQAASTAELLEELPDAVTPEAGAIVAELAKRGVHV